MPAAISLDRVTKAYASGKGVFDASFEVAPGEIFGFLGPNGAGKTTLIRVLLGYLRADGGRAAVLGHDCFNDAVAVHRRIGYVPAEFRLDEEDTAIGLLTHLARFRPPGALERAKAIAERLDLKLDGRIKRFSKGMKQKVALIQALMHAPELLILDEPSEGLDPLVQHALHALLRERAAAGGTVFFSSHALAEVEQLCDRVAVIGNGRILTVEAIASLRAKRTRVLRLAFSAPVPPERLVIPDATLRHADASGATFAYAGSAQALLPVLAGLPLADFTLEPAPLEEAFLGFYQ
jgi:ABC-2 type transport system ATP-binding protein